VAAEENSQFIINNEEGGDIAKFQKENDFIYRELNSLQPPLFLMERLEKAQRLGNSQEQEIINELQTTLIQKKDEIERIKKIIEETKVVNNSNKKNKRSSVTLSSIESKANLKKRTKSQIINVNNINLSMNGNKKVIEDVRKYLASGKKILDEKEGMDELSRQVEKALQTDDDNNLKEECDKLYNELGDEKYKSVSNISGGVSRVILKNFLDG